MKPSFGKSNRYKDKKHKIKEDNTLKANSSATNPIQQTNVVQKEDSQIIRGYFLNEKSYKEIIIQRVNTFLCCILGFLVVFCFVCYYFVSCKEVQLNQISRETLELNYENEELQNKVDSLQSYYNIDRAVSKANILERAKQVVEVNAIDLSKVDLNNSKMKNKAKNTMIVNY